MTVVVREGCAEVRRLDVCRTLKEGSAKLKEGSAKLNESSAKLKEGSANLKEGSATHLGTERGRGV